MIGYPGASGDYTHCRRCGIELIRPVDTLDGLCSAGTRDPEGARCYGRFVSWCMRADCPVPPETVGAAHGSAQPMVAIDQWLERGCP